jgi:ribosomal protein L44E
MDLDPKKFPKDDFIIQAIKEILQKRLKVDTQERLCYLVLKKLRKYDEDFVLSPKRVKQIALRIPEIEVKAKTRRIPRMRRIEKCPVCGGKIVPFYGKNLANKKIILGYKCMSCEYMSDLESFMPMKYIFLLKQKS